MSSQPHPPDAEMERRLWAILQPNWVAYASLPFFAALLIVGLTGNFLVIFVVVRNESMRTVTNYFLVNLALADFMALLFCLPFTVLWEITSTWWFGTAMCKIILYCQTLSVSVSVLTLTCISIERWHAICHPLSFKNTPERTRTSLIIVWLIAALLSLPEMVILEAKPLEDLKNVSTIYFYQCDHTWSEHLQQGYSLAQTVVLYVVPLCLMAVMYGQIAYMLWVKSVPPSDPSYGYSNGSDIRNGDASSISSSSNLQPNRNQLQKVSSNSDRLQLPQVAEETTGKRSSATKTAQPLEQWKEREIVNRRKAAKMLIAIVVLFTVCYFPTHLFNALRYFGIIIQVDPGPAKSALALGMRLLCYFNSCVNPIVYNFMSEKFQREFRRACSCLPAKYRSPNISKAATLANLPARRPLLPTTSNNNKTQMTNFESTSFLLKRAKGEPLEEL